MTRSAYRMFLALVLCGALALIASGCSGDGDSAGTADITAPAQTAAVAPATQTAAPAVVADDQAAIALMERGGVSMFVVPPERLGEMSDVPGEPEGAYMNVDLSFEDGDTAAQERAMARVLQGELVFAFRYANARDARAAAKLLSERIAQEQERASAEDAQRAPVAYSLLRRANLVAMLATTDPQSTVKDGLGEVMVLLD